MAEVAEVAEVVVVEEQTQIPGELTKRPARLQITAAQGQSGRPQRGKQEGYQSEE